MGKIKNRFAELVAEKERQEGRRWRYEDITEKTGVAMSTLSAYARNKVRRFDAVTVEALLDFFGCTVAEFFTLEDARKAEDSEGQMMAVALPG